jgi:serine/threonine protein kinase
MEANVGLEIDKRYKLIKKIGEGGMGTVYLANQLHVNRQVVLKILKPNLCVNEEQVQRFRREAQLASQLSHPNSVITYDFNIYRGMPYIAMEALEGEPLSDLLERRETLSIEQTVHILKQVCSSLKEAHDKGMVHRDLKPENIFLLSEAVDQYDVKVLDFGIAKLMTHHPDAQKSNLTRNDMIYGTPQYMSPEQIRGKDINARSDIYAIAVILHQCLLGSLPYDSQIVVDILTQHLTQPIPYIDSYDLFSDESLQCFNQVIEQGMAKNSKDRISDAEGMIEALDQLLDTVKVKLEPEPSVQVQSDSTLSKVILAFILLIALLAYGSPQSPISPFPPWYPQGWHAFIPQPLGIQLKVWFPEIEVPSSYNEAIKNPMEDSTEPSKKKEQILTSESPSEETNLLKEDNTLNAQQLEMNTDPTVEMDQFQADAGQPTTEVDQFKGNTEQLNTDASSSKKITQGVIKVESHHPTRVVEVYLNQKSIGHTPIRQVVTANLTYEIRCEYKGQVLKKRFKVKARKAKRLTCF